jgi:hypothetical protein
MLSRICRSSKDKNKGEGNHTTKEGVERRSSARRGERSVRRPGRMSGSVGEHPEKAMDIPEQQQGKLINC